MINTLDAIGSLERVSFEEVMVPDLGSIQTFEADIQVEADCGDYIFRVVRVYTHQAGADGDGFFSAQLNGRLQIDTALALRTFVETDPSQIARLEELADEAGLRQMLREAA